MSATCSSPAICPAFCLAAEGFEPGGGSERDHFTGLHGRQAGQDILEVVAGDYAKAAAVFHDGVEDRAFLPGPLVAYEESRMNASLRLLDEPDAERIVIRLAVRCFD